MAHTRIDHPLPPIFDRNSRILILGSFPSVKTRAAGFPYGHPQNRFWPVLTALLQRDPPLSAATPDYTRSVLLTHGIALWDSIASCAIIGSSDSSIRDVVPHDFSEIFSVADIRHVFCNGAASYRYFKKYQPAYGHVPSTQLPSTSPANAAASLARLIEAWAVILGPLQHGR